MDNNVILDDATVESVQNLINEISVANSIMGNAESTAISHVETEDNTVINTPVSASAAMGGQLSEEEMMKLYANPPKTRPLVRNYKKIGRNDKCPCGSGKKYKNCCMNSGKYDGYTQNGTQQDPYVDGKDTEEAA